MLDLRRRQFNTRGRLHNVQAASGLEVYPFRPLGPQAPGSAAPHLGPLGPSIQYAPKSLKSRPLVKGRHTFDAKFITLAWGILFNGAER